MTPERLAAIKEHFKNPPSASCNREWALEVIAELELRHEADRLNALSLKQMNEAGLRTLTLPSGTPVTDAAGLLDAIDEVVKPVVIDDRPEPKKKGKHK